jgi:flagellar hook-associated protein 2
LSTSGVSFNSGAGSPISFQGLASGLNTGAIISALLAAERQPIIRLTDEQAKLQGEQQQIQSIQTSLQQLAFAASEFSLASAFESSQAVTSSEPARIGAVSGAGAPVGGHEVEVTQLANSAQRSFAFTSPASEATITIDGHEFAVKAGATAKELANAINSNSSATVYAAVLEGGTVVLSDRATGAKGAEFIKVTGAVLSEQAETAREGKNAEFKVDGVAGTSASNTVSNAIAGVTLTLNGLTPTGPVTIDVQAPGPSVAAVEGHLQSFIKLYNSTIEAIHKELSTKPLAKPQSGAEFGVGALFGDLELTRGLDSMRQSMYQPITGLSAEMSSPADVGISTGAATGGASTSQASIAGVLTLNASKLAEAVQANPAGVQQMFQQWSKSFQSMVNASGGPGGSLEARANREGQQITQLTRQIATKNELFALREKALQETYARLEAVLSQNNSQSQALTREAETTSKPTG